MGNDNFMHVNLSEERWNEIFGKKKKKPEIEEKPKEFA